MQILTLKALPEKATYAITLLVDANFTYLTSTNVQILTLKAVADKAKYVDCSVTWKIRAPEGGDGAEVMFLVHFLTCADVCLTYA